MKTFFLPEFVDQALPFREAGRSVRALLLWESSPDAAKMPIVPAPYEISDASLRIVGPLWGVGAVIEPFFVATLVNELCDVFDGALLRSARDQDVKRYEEAVFLSSWCVFLALHLGQCSLAHLNAMRVSVFKAIALREEPAMLDVDGPELLSLARASYEASRYRKGEGSFFEGRDEKVAQRIASRLKRVRGTMIREGIVLPSIYGEKGFADAGG